MYIRPCSYTSRALWAALYPGKLCLHLGHKADAEVLSQMMHEMDYTGEGTVQLMEFQIWYYANKYGRPCWAPCPVRFLDTIAGMLTIQPFGPVHPPAPAPACPLLCI